MNLKNLRKNIDSIDKKIIQFLNARAKITLDIARLKRKHGANVYVPEREREVLQKVTKVSRGPLTKDGLQSIYREIMSSSLALEKPLKIAYFGPQATFTHLAALKKFGSQVEYLACDSIADVFLEVERDAADYGVVPIENSV
jgi:chorismate mutase/prephenate dehydratase